MRRASLIFFSLLVGSESAWSANSSRELNIAVKFDQSFYNLELTDSFFSFREGPTTFRAKAKPCNRAVLAKKRDEYNSLLTTYSSPTTGKSEFDVQVTDRDGKVLSVARGSKFGSWLRDLPKTMMYFNAEVKASCKR